MDEKARMWRQASLYGAVGIEMAAAVGIGTIGGHWLDERFGFGGLGVGFGFVVGVGAAITAMARAIAGARAAMRRQD